MKSALYNATITAQRDALLTALGVVMTVAGPTGQKETAMGNIVDGVKTDLADLGESLKIWRGQPDVWDRVENWLFNTNRHLENAEVEVEEVEAPRGKERSQ